jgi:type IV pilus assembly protein PilV
MPLPAENSKAAGFTLIEVMVAMLILSIGLMALIQTLGYVISHNFSNRLRVDAVMIADRAMMHDRVQPFSAIFSANTSAHVPFALGFVNYSVRKKVTMIGYSSPKTSKQIQYTVAWRDKSVRKQHFLTTIIGN